MVKHNNVIPFQHFHKKWARRVKTWLDQPAQKRIRRDRRKQKAARVAPRPASGDLRPVVKCPTQKYNMKTKLGRGFTLEEIRGAGLDPKYARTVGIAVDHRRTNKCEESLKANIERLNDYKTRLVVFKKGKGTLDVPQLTGEVAPKAAKPEAVSFINKSELEGLKENKVYYNLRNAWNDARTKGIREKRLKEGKKDAPAAAAGGAGDD